ncbi:alanyl-tRNA editing protein [Natronorarus salvus]|uniref:alanyl-tRNA editing protein n=1 Tax=Natronorarus salvus TaxID=3117733 RepID=UPI002F2665A8
MTEPLYLTDSSRGQFEARVDRTLDDRVVLDRTCFYPTGGGQPHDTGTLSTDDRTWRVTDVAKRDTIYHTVDGPEPPEVGETVVGDLDWERRAAHMRYHTVQHLLSAYLLESYDAPTTGNQLYADRARLDCGYERFTDDDLAGIETGLNDLIDSDLPVRWYEMDREAAEADLGPERTRLDLLPESITEVRIVDIGDAEEPYDRTACAGTHVESTGLIGELSVTDRETRGSDEERLSFTLE